MKTFSDVLKNMIDVNWSGEKLYSLQELRLYLSNVDILIDEEILITPFYCDKQKRYELHQYELVLGEKSGYMNFKKFLQEKNEKQRIDILDKKNLNGLSQNQKKLFQIYIEILLNSQQLKNEIEKIFGVFNENQLYLVFY